MTAAGVKSELAQEVIAELTALQNALKAAYTQLNNSDKEMIKAKSELSKEETEKQCINCHKPYHPRLNTDSSCTYHSGKIKFYSCK